LIPSLSSCSWPTGGALAADVAVTKVGMGMALAGGANRSLANAHATLDTSRDWNGTTEVWVSSSVVAVAATATTGGS
jgi:hypothetical protein